VTSKGLGLVAALLMSENRIPTTVGYIIKNKRMPIGIESCLNFKESMNCPNSGRNFPMSKPRAMHITIHRVRYFSKIPRVSGFLGFGESAKAYPSGKWQMTNYILRYLNMLFQQTITEHFV
jgi:hypothetical protein